MKATLGSKPAERTHAPAASHAVRRRASHATLPRQSAHASSQAIENTYSTPRVATQRRQLQAAFGNAIQRETEAEEEELLQGRFSIAQRQVTPEEEELQMKAALPVVQRQGLEEDEPMQGKFSAVTPVAQLKAEPDQKANPTGMPDSLKSGIEALSGLDMADVRVHRNSAKPAQLNALAYAQGSHIHLGPGQEQHLPHEAWHLVQQRQGRVRATLQAAGQPINDDAALEREADVMGVRALQAKPDES